MTTCKAYLIDSESKQITLIDYEINTMSAVIGARSICVGWTFINGDVLYVDDEGLLRPQRHFFRMKERRDQQPYAGDGILVGREVETEDVPEGYYTEPPSITIEQLSSLIEWMDRKDVRRWVTANTAEAATSITTIEDGVARTTALVTVAELWAVTLGGPDDNAGK